MNKNKNNIGVASISIILGLSMLMFFAQACTHKVSFATSQVVPAAEGTVKVSKEKNNNYQIDLNVRRLADPKRLSPAKDVYVVWMETENDGIKNIGQLTTSSSMFSSALKSSLKTVSPYKPVRIFITAEDNAAIAFAVGQIVLDTNNF